MYRFVISGVILSLVIQCSRAEIGLIVNTTLGEVRGVAGDEFTSFLGIPYAQVNESNPFGDAGPHPIFEEIFEANNDTKICPAFNSTANITMGSLDCLHVNLYVPNSAHATSQLAVMMFVHGGHFTEDNTMIRNYGPRFLVRHGVIVVTIEYRLGVYGFMCLNVPQAPGNRGLRDQFLAIRWIKDNIEAFGGNPDDLTLYGQSAGGHAVDLHLHSDETRMFNKVILESGSALSASVLYEPDREAPFKLASYLGFNTSDIQKALSFLANSTANDVILAQTASEINFRPCVEYRFDGVESFITTSWVNKTVPNIQGMPILVGVTEYELLASHVDRNSSYFASISNIFSSYLNQTFDFDDVTLERAAAMVRQFYMGDDPMDSSAVMPVSEFDSDFTYIVPVHRRVTKYLESGATNVFYYVFAFVGDRSYMVTNNNTIARAVHTDSLHYIFDIQSLPNSITQGDQTVIDIMTTLWTNFAKYGNPTPRRPPVFQFTWRPVTNETLNYLLIGDDLVMEQRPFNRRMAFWDFFNSYYGNYMKLFVPEESE